MSLPTTGTGRSVWSVQFYAENDGIDFGSGSEIDDMPTADCTIEFYIKISAGSGSGTCFSKSNVPSTDGWTFFYSTVTGFLTLYILHATNDVVVTSPALDNNKWHHIAIDWDFGTLTARMFVGGNVADTDTAVGAYLVDAANDCIYNGRSAIGTADMSQSVGPIRLSNTRRYTGASFDPPRRINWPANDANAQLITRMNDGAGATVTDYSGNGYDGTITFGANTRWYNDPV